VAVHQLLLLKNLYYLILSVKYSDFAEALVQGVSDNTYT